MSANDIFDFEPAPFKSELRGSFGVVKTNSSHELNFVLSSLDIARVNDLETASSALDMQFARFSDLLQRDIDFERVRGIIDEYLEKGADRTVFFPPLLVSLVAFEDPDPASKITKITEYFQCVDDTVDNGWLVRTWDNNRFQIRLRTAVGEGAVAIQHSGAVKEVLPFGCYLKWNPRVVKLVIIDGQHRLCALQTIFADPQRRHILQDMHIPICVVFPPNATVGNPRGESIRATLRDLFVTINQTAKQVSGHFIVLLDDKKLSSMAIRDLAELWKGTQLSAGLTKLHLLEWNQRLKAKTNQRDRKHSITTVSIVADVLERDIFDAATGGMTCSFLNLTECRADLEIADSFPTIESISNQEFRPQQAAVLQRQISAYVTPALDVLFTKPSPYKRKIEKLISAKLWLDAEVSRMANGALDFRDQCLAHYRESTDLDYATVRPIEAEFEERCEHEEADNPFFLNVFQQGMLRAWVEISRELLRHSIAPVDAADALIAALEVIAFSNKKSYFSSEKNYTRLTLYRDGGAVIVTEVAKEQWKRLILMTLAATDAKEAFERSFDDKLSVEQITAFREDIKPILEAAQSDFLEDFRKATQRDFQRNWKDRDLTAQQQETIRNVITTEGDPSEAFVKAIAEHLTGPRVKRARSTLNKVLELG